VLASLVLQTDQIKVNVMNTSTWHVQREKMNTGLWFENLKKRDHSKDLGLVEG
jgi:hypothetical protein